MRRRIEVTIRWSYDEKDTPLKGEELLRKIKKEIKEDIEQLGEDPEIEIKFIEGGYIIGKDGKSITCQKCGMTSYHPEDIINRYCDNCHIFHSPDDEKKDQP